MFTLEDDILVNQWVQGVQNTPVLLEWFESGSAERKLEILRYLVSLCKQARATSDEGLKAILASALNPRRSAGVLLAKGANTEIFNKLATLKNADGVDAFVLLLHLLKIADGRRKSSEDPASCTHWWHRDLSDTAVIESIRKDYLSGKLGCS